VLRALLLAAALAASLNGCAADRASADCKNVCRREAQCVEEAADEKPAADARFDQSECVAACSALQRDEDGKKLVADHVACVNRSSECDAVMKCQ
jgi:hypothetical protein